MSPFTAGSGREAGRWPCVGKCRGPGRAGRTPGAGGGTSCAKCGGAAEWHRTVRGRWILIEPGDRPVGSPPGSGGGSPGTGRR